MRSVIVVGAAALLLAAGCAASPGRDECRRGAIRYLYEHVDMDEGDLYDTSDRAAAIYEQCTFLLNEIEG